MATFHGIIFMVALCIANGAFKATSKTTEDEHVAPAQAPLHCKKLPPKVTNPTVYQKFLDACVRGMTDQCADQIIDGIFSKKHVSDICCVKLVSMGHDCHNELINRLLKIPEFKKNITESKSRSDHIWSKCSTLAKKIAAAPASNDATEESRKNWKFLEECAKTMTIKCADQIVGSIFSNKKVTNDCCVKLVRMGDKCHKALVKQFLKAPETKVDKKKIKSKSDKLWAKCGKVAHSPPAPKAP